MHQRLLDAKHLFGQTNSIVVCKRVSYSDADCLCNKFCYQPGDLPAFTISILEVAEPAMTNNLYDSMIVMYISTKFMYKVVPE